MIQGDIGEEADAERAFDEATEALGMPDMLVNSAGLNMSAVDVADMALEQWERVLKTDLTGTFLTSRRLVRDLKAAGTPGAIINITSIHAHRSTSSSTSSPASPVDRLPAASSALSASAHPSSAGTQSNAAAWTASTPASLALRS